MNTNKHIFKQMAEIVSQIADNHKYTATTIKPSDSLDEIFDFYEERIGSRIAGYYDIYCFFGDDIRFKINRG